MATIDLGKIKQVWRGTYNNSTAYAVDDLVEYTDSGITSSYICTTASTGNAPSSSGTVHGSWAYVAKGASGSPTTTAGDIIYRGASADARLAKGTAGQVLKMNSGATAPEWGADQGGKVVNFWHVHTTTDAHVQQGTSSGNTTLNLATVTFTPSSTSNKLIMSAQIQVHDQTSSASGSNKAYFRNDTASANYDSEEYQSPYPFYPHAQTIGTGSGGGSTYGPNFMLHNIFSVPNTNEQTWKIVGWAYNDGAAAHVQQFDTRGSHWTIYEVTPT